MRSPFPGMDPWLESPSLWPDVHTRLIARLGDLLGDRLAPRYFVNVERRVYLLSGADRDGLIVPDITVARSRAGKRLAKRPPRRATPEPITLTLVDDPIEVREPRLVIRGVGGDRPVVTVIELLSPANKTLGSHGRYVYLEKRHEVLGSRAHLVEIDLLRGGARLPTVEEWPPGDYAALVSRASDRPRAEVYVWTVRDRLPEVPIPLETGEPDALLDLAAALRTTYEHAHYELAIDYTRPPEPPLPATEAAWAAKLARR